MNRKMLPGSCADNYRAMKNQNESLAESPTSRRPTYRRSTTALGCVVVILAIIGVLSTSLSLVYYIFRVPPSTPAYQVNVVNCALAVLAKIGLLVLGISILRRSPQIYVVGGVVTSIILIDWVYFLVAIPPVDRSHLHPQMVAALNIGTFIGNSLSILLYVGIFVYLLQPAARQEFGTPTKCLDNSRPQ